MDNEKTDIIDEAILTNEKVIKDKLICKGDDIVDGIDYSHFNFLIMHHKDELEDMLGDPTKSTFDCLKMFWEIFYPYLEAEIEDKETLFKKGQDVAEDADMTVQLGMEFKFKLDHAEEILKQSGKMMWNSYQTRLIRASAQLKSEIERQKADGTIK